MYFYYSLGSPTPTHFPKVYIRKFIRKETLLKLLGAREPLLSSFYLISVFTLSDAEARAAAAAVETTIEKSQESERVPSQQQLLAIEATPGDEQADG